MRTLLLALALALTVSDASAQLRLPLVLSDGAVLQRDHPIPVWGWAPPGAAVTVRLGAESERAQAGADGRWQTALAARPAGGPHTLVVTAGGERVEATDLLVGDVWVLSGQSNMEWALRDADQAEAVLASAEDGRIRHFTVPRSFADEPQAELAGGAWVVGAPETIGAFSAVGTFFARAVRRHHDVPIGLLHASWGGSRIEPWMSAEMLGLSPTDVAAIRDQEQVRQDTLAARLRAHLGTLPTEDAGMDGDRPLWAAPDLDVSGWEPLRVPSLWEDAGYPGLDGVAWLRTSVTLSADQAAEGVTLGLGMIDDDDVTWVNGVEVGRTVNGWNQPRRYAVPAAALRPGANTIAVRVVDGGGGGGIAGADDLVYLETADGHRRSLVGDGWRFQVAVVRLDANARKNQVPMGLWNQMVHPLTAQPVAGVLWYQGESNGDRIEDAAAYGERFRALIEGWRDAWGDDELPFLWAQLAAFRPPPTGPDDTGLWPIVREGQSAALALDRTAEAVLLDVGDADDIHPLDKRTVGERLALAARAMVYGDTLVASGPRYRAHRVDGQRVTVSFDHVGGGLTTRGGQPLGGFALLDADGRWHDADARIEADRVVVSSPAVPAPIGVRYAWADNPVAATLTNVEGLPAAPFRAGE